MLNCNSSKFTLNPMIKPTHNSRHITSFDDLLRCSTVFDLEITTDSTQGYLRDAAVFAANEIPSPENSQQQSALSIATELKHRQFVIGHNIVEHDIPELEKLTGQNLTHLHLVDTLWISPLAFPERNSHRLRKPYYSTQSKADPIKDCLESLDLMRKGSASLAKMDKDWLLILRYLCGLGTTHAGYNTFFDIILGNDKPKVDNNIADLKHIHDIITQIFQGDICIEGLEHQLNLAFELKNGWPLAWVLSWVRHRNRRAAPCEWLLKGADGFQNVLNEIGRRRCLNKSCQRCSTHETTLKSMVQWFPPSKNETPSFQPPVGPDGITYQELIMENVLFRRSLLGILPTGTGKSRCFQVPGLEQHAYTGDLTVVVSPLKSLMENQTNKAEAENLPGIVRLHSDIDIITRDKIIQDIKNGIVAILYVSPETLGIEQMRSILKTRRIGLWVFDEAHCILTWGKGFRDDYQRAPKWITECGASGSEHATILCLTATARPETKLEIQRVFKPVTGDSLKIIDGGSERQNLTYMVKQKNDDVYQQLSKILNDPDYLPKDGQAIIYAHKRDDAEVIAKNLQNLGHDTKFYHAGLKVEEKKKVEHAFTSGKLRLIVSTIAFGMGVDCPNVRLVLHIGPSNSIEAYVQETGRAGRNKQPAKCILIYNPDEHHERLGKCVLNHVKKEDMDIILAHILNVQRNIKRNDNPCPPISLVYKIMAEDVMGFMVDSKSPRKEEFQKSRVDRVISELESHGLIRKIQLSSENSNIEVNQEILVKLKDDSDLSKIESKIIDFLLNKMVEGEELKLPGNDELVYFCGITHEKGKQFVRKALNTLRKRQLLYTRNTLDLTISKQDKITNWIKKCDIITVVLFKLIKAQKDKTKDYDDTVSFPKFKTTLRTIQKIAQTELEGEITAKEILCIFDEFQKIKLINFESNPAGLTRFITFEIYFNQGEFNERLTSHHHKTRRILKTLQKLKNNEQNLQIEINLLIDEVKHLDLDIHSIWKETDGSVFTSDKAERLIKNQLYLLANIKAIYISNGLYKQSEVIQVEVVKRDSALTVRSYTQKMFQNGIENFQQEEIRQLHLMDGYAKKVYKNPHIAPKLLKTYLTEFSKSVLSHFYSNEELQIVRKNRPASVQMQIELCNRLDERQSEIVHDDTSLKDMLVLAGPGAGKTRILVERIIWLVRIERVPIEHILALCYNRRAAEEIRKRLQDKSALGDFKAKVSVYTYHSFALQILGQSFSEISNDAASEESQQLDKDADSGKKAFIFDQILLNASERLTKLRENGGNLSDLILRRFHWVFVDEFQDVTDNSFALIKEIAQQSQKKKAEMAHNASDLINVRFIAVGDDDQNIYDFSGANGQYIRAFSDFFNVSKKPHELTWNYRSSGAILKTTADIISRCKGRLKTCNIEINPKRANDHLQGNYYQPHTPEIGQVTVLPSQNTGIEAQAIIAAEYLLKMNRAIPKNKWKWNSTAILVRRRAHIPIVERALSAAGIEISRNIRNLVPFSRVKEVVYVRHWLEQKAKYGQALTPSNIREFISKFEIKFQKYWSDIVASWLYDYLDKYEKENTASSPEIILDEFSEWSHEWVPYQTGVIVLTAHTSKGLEFDNVVICDDKWLQNTMLTDADRRLFYVAATRARHSLSIITSHFMEPTKRIMETNPGPHLRQINIKPNSTVIDTKIHTYLTPCSVRDVFLSFPAWDGPGCKQDEKIISSNLQRISSLQTGSKIRLHKTSNPNDKNAWHIFIDDGQHKHRIGKMQKDFMPYDSGEDFFARVFALVNWQKNDSKQDYHKEKIRRNNWLAVIPEWGSSDMNSSLNHNHVKKRTKHTTNEIITNADVIKSDNHLTPEDNSSRQTTKISDTEMQPCLNALQTDTMRDAKDTAIREDEEKTREEERIHRLAIQKTKERELYETKERAYARAEKRILARTEKRILAKAEEERIHKEAWNRLKTAHNNNQHVEGVISCSVKGGFTVNLDDAVAFLPNTQVDVRPVYDIGPLINLKQPFLILKMDHRRNNIVVSRRAVLEKSRTEQHTKAIDNLSKGQIIEGVVKNITEYGAFIDLGDIDGLLHITDMAKHRVKHPSEILTIGETVKVQIIKIDKKTNHINLGMKQLQNDPWDLVDTRYPQGTVHRGLITNITDYGAFVELETGVKGLIHVSEMSWTKKKVQPGKIVSMHQEVDVKVLEINKSKHQISLSLKQAQRNPWEVFVETHPKGTEIRGKVKNITKFGLFIGIEDNIDGLVHLSDLSWNEHGNNVIQNYCKGDVVQAVVSKVDVEKMHVSLSIKALNSNKFTCAMNGINHGSIITVKVISIKKGGIDIEYKGTKSFIRRSDLSRTREEQRPERFSIGDKIDVRVTKINKKTRQLGLSIKAREIAEEKDIVEQYGSSNSNALLGDILGPVLKANK